MSGFICFAAAKFDCLSSNCSLRAVMMFLGRVVWSALVVKWSASLLTSTFGFTVLAVGAYPFIFLISRQICVVFISASWLHDISLFRSVGLALKSLVSWLTCFVHFFGFWGKEGTSRLGGLGS